MFDVTKQEHVSSIYGPFSDKVKQSAQKIFPNAKYGVTWYHARQVIMIIKLPDKNCDFRSYERFDTSQVAVSKCPAERKLNFLILTLNLKKFNF